MFLGRRARNTKKRKVEVVLNEYEGPSCLHSSQRRQVHLSTVAHRTETTAKRLMTTIQGRAPHATSSVSSSDVRSPLQSPPTLDPVEQYKFLQDDFFHEWDAEHELPQARARTAADNPMKEWLEERDKFLDEFLRLDGRGISESEWQGHYFKPVPLRDLGLRIQLNHPPGEDCFSAQSTGDNFIIVDAFQIHEVAINFLAKLEDAQESGLRACRRRHRDETRRPNINLPSGWNEVAEDKRWLYALFLGIDANFRLKRKIVSSEQRDLSLGMGWAFFVEETAYKSHINANWNLKQPKSTCVLHKAVNKPDKEARGLLASGAGTVDCAHHDMKRPNAVGDLQLGERYMNMDYLILSSLKDTEIESLVLSYDIVCQWSINWHDRMMSYPRGLQASSSIKEITFLVPKFHLPAHIEECNLSYSFNLTRGMGRTDGEAPEHGWVNINPIAQSTKEMGPGSRRDTIYNHFNDWNWKKKIQLGKRMLTKIQEAAKGSREHADALRELEAAIPKDVIEEWAAEVERWEHNPVNAWKAGGWKRDESVANPYAYKSKGISKRSICLKLAQEVERITKERGVGKYKSRTNACFRYDCERHKLAAEMADLGTHPTAKQLSELLERSNQLRHKIATWMDVQALFMPEAVQQRARQSQKGTAEGITATQVYEIPLWLTSALAKLNIIVPSALRLYEWHLRHGQAHDSLNDCSHILRLKSYLYKYKDKYTRGVRGLTRTNSVIEAATGSLHRAAYKYSTARDAMIQVKAGLNVPTSWKTTLWPLSITTDLRALSEGLVGDSKGRQTISWIWLYYPITESSDDNPRLNEALKIEWCRA
ncbi:hypothetical protein H0H92_002841 [Tricholoma furcatifolium]|nr:hypothetical protein H0H92_002841 [Tricholoma furcatifolium]